MYKNNLTPFWIFCCFLFRYIGKSRRLLDGKRRTSFVTSYYMITRRALPSLRPSILKQPAKIVCGRSGIIGYKLSVGLWGWKTKNLEKPFKHVKRLWRGCFWTKTIGQQVSSTAVLVGNQPLPSVCTMCTEPEQRRLRILGIMRHKVISLCFEVRMG